MMRNRGITVLEITAALAILAPALFTITMVVHRAAKTTIKATIEAQSGINHLRFRNIFSDLMEDLDSHRLPVLPRIHKNGLINFTDGASNPVMQATGGRRPDSNSDAITGLKLDLLNSQRVIQAAQNGSRAALTACNRFLPVFSPREYKSYAGLSVDGIAELVGEVQPHPGRPDCHDFLLQAGSSMSFAPTETLHPAKVRLLIPIINHYTWYIDEKRRLRFLSHAGELNIENQPAANDSGRIRLDLMQSSNGISFIRAEYEIKENLWRELWFNNNLSRLPTPNLLMNMP